jgi:hypothetical protein
LPISSIRGIAIQPTKAKTATLDSWGTGNSQVNNTWYTIVNVTSGTGLLSRVMASIFNGTTYVSNVNTQIKITVDGVSETLSNGFNALIGANALRGSEHNMGQTTTGYALSWAVFDYQQPVYFYSSLKVEVLATTPTGFYIEAFVDYAIV